LTGGSPDEGGWQWFKREMGNLFVIRHDDMPSPSPERRVDRVRSFLAGNRVDMAIIEVERMPGHDAATEWLAHARDYVMTQHALDQLETAALVTPTPPPPATIVPSRRSCRRPRRNRRRPPLPEPRARPQPRSSAGKAPLIPRASSMNQRLSGAARCTPAMPKRRIALGMRPGMPNKRVSTSVAAATMKVSAARQRS
jgi:hypothetical protein